MYHFRPQLQVQRKTAVGTWRTVDEARNIRDARYGLATPGSYRLVRFFPVRRGRRGCRRIDPSSARLFEVTQADVDRRAKRIKREDAAWAREQARLAAGLKKKCKPRPVADFELHKGTLRFVLKLLRYERKGDFIKANGSLGYGGCLHPRSSREITVINELLRSKA